MSPSQGMVDSSVTPTINKEEDTMVGATNSIQLREADEDAAFLRLRGSKAVVLPSSKNPEEDAAQAKVFGKTTVEEDSTWTRTLSRRCGSSRCSPERNSHAPHH